MVFVAGPSSKSMSARVLRVHGGETLFLGLGSAENKSRRI
jgi:hypothetical protein